MSALKRYSNRNNTTGNKYETIIGTDELYRNFIQAHRDLSYSLRKEVKRDRFVLNSEGLEKDIEEYVIECLNKYQQDFIEGSIAMILNGVQNSINSISGTYGNMTITTNNSIGSIANSITVIAGKAIAKGIVDMIDSAMDID